MDEEDKAVVARSVKDVHKALGMWSIRRALAMAFSGAAVLLVAAWFLVSWLLGSPPRAKAKPLDTSAQLDLLKLVFALVAGIGALVALVTAYRRQRIDEVAGERAERIQAHAERIQAHAEQVARDNAHDATERRVTDLYGKAVEQLGHDKAAVRLGGLYALERLAQDHSEHRQTIVDVICGYLRMPYHYTAPTTATPQPEQAIQNLPPETHEDGQRQELQVRLTAQRILARLLRIRPPTARDPSPIYPDSYWDEIDLDLTGAHLIDFDLTGCRPHDANFSRAQFSGDAWFGGVRFGGVAWFREAQFGRHAEFREAQFGGNAEFSEAQFGGDAGFREAQFGSHAGFSMAQFGEWAGFSMARFSRDARFDKARFSGDARFDKAQFEERPVFVGAAAGLPADQHLWPQGWRTDPPAPDQDMAPLVHSSDGASR